MKIVCHIFRSLMTMLATAHACVAMASLAPEMTQINDTLPEITVVAIKGESLVAPATATTVISEQTVERQNILSVKDAADIIPNFYVPDYGSRMTSSIYVRGLGARIDQPAIGLIVDNMPVMNKDAFDFDIDDITSIRMMRGPQSTMYGRNTMAGLIDVATLSPLNWQGLRAAASYGSGNTWHASAGLYHKLKTPVGLSINLGAGGTNGFFTNKATGRKCDYGNDYSARIKADWRPASELRVLNTLSATYATQGGYPYEYVPTAEIAYNDTCSYKRTFISDGLTVAWSAPKFILTSVSSWQYLNDEMRLDQDFLPLDYFTLTQSRNENTFTQDVLIKSNSCGESIYSWLFGAFAFYKHTQMDAPVTFKDYGIEQLIEKHRNEANPHYPIRWVDRSFPLDSHFTYPATGLAAYHRSEFKIGKWTFTAGLRLDWERATLTYHSHCNTAYEIYQETPSGEYVPMRYVPVNIDRSGHLAKSFLELLPKLSASYNLSNEVWNGSAYLSAAKGYKAGGFNTQMFSDVLQQHLMQMLGVGMTYDVDDIVGYKPEKSWNYELGINLASLSGIWSGEAALFYIDCTDQQLTVFPEGNTTGRIMTNAGKTRSWGAELSMHIRPVNPFELQFSYGYTNAKFREFNNGKVSYRGKYVPYSPAHTLYAGAAYTFSLPFSFCHSLCIEANLKGVGKIYWDEANTLSQPFYLLPCASVTFAHPRWSLQFWGNNLSDTRYSTFYFVSISHQFLQRGLPATAGVTLRFNLEAI